MILFKSHYLKILFWVLIVATLILTLMPAKEVPDVFIFWDKMQHSLCFAALAFVGLLAYKKAMPMCVSLSIYGILIELMQTFLTSTRHGDVLDWVADMVGIVVGTLFVALIKKWTPKKLNLT